ncbi:tRNA (N6-threonylcarbamoyladenosine(37)-N6)-methyltransferase TrmO [uncultured Cohaesibacter sp.]|uniref:tRNA (N6-threonylcarbamoyladenosine(37)-N6)-methyltransferase TrmO n=1 Tax=uncultured Cohaesibacter sp. TaxID=1002546 RepID=UPI00292F56B6|nr:tRNA (N6-threonylcarbamoyladenosine(37)-N6)-methyltransferase TrmO [uncultured Cohaesibacter sp.]
MTVASSPSFSLYPIGKIWTGFESPKDCPHNSRFNEKESTIELDDAYGDALMGLAAASHLIVLYWLDQANRSVMQSRPPHADKTYGVFAIRSPHRPNPIAISAVKILGIDANRIRVSGLDCIDGTPLLDLKPYVPRIDCIEEAKLDLDWSEKHMTGA